MVVTYADQCCGSGSRIRDINLSRIRNTLADRSLALPQVAEPGAHLFERWEATEHAGVPETEAAGGGEARGRAEDAPHQSGLQTANGLQVS
jgi:hypothetical protein